MHGTNKTEKLEISPCDHCDAVGDDDYVYNDDSEDDYDDVGKEEKGERY
jgi:hypothetical protein